MSTLILSFLEAFRLRRHFSRLLPSFCFIASRSAPPTQAAGPSTPARRSATRRSRSLVRCRRCGRCSPRLPNTRVNQSRGRWRRACRPG
ncbi:MAG TPA: hypothetical protein DDZ88_22625 [Verrucomicrobiales bacterium]|nr:hypothetical protein [Verrucomicrobiales bacterium]